MMNLKSFRSRVGPVLLALVVIGSIAKVLTTHTEEARDGRRTVRLAHWQLESGLRNALDAVISEYESLHPDVNIEQVPVPERLGKNWMRTQLVGGTAPTIIQIGGMGITDEVLARYFLPISAYLESPNPYNADTELAQTPWRETFIDLLASPPAYNPGLLEYYGISATVFVIRIYYNVDLLKRITGSEETPENYGEFLELCQQVIEYGKEKREAGRPGDILPIAGSKYNAPMMINDLFAGITQQLVLKTFPDSTLSATADTTTLAYLQGIWNWNSPDIVKALDVTREIGQYMQPGFLQLGRDDAMFYFAQQRALMICTGSFDATSIRVQSPFRVGVFKMPLPSGEDPEFANYIAGQFSEGSTGTGFTLGIVRNAPHVDDAINFLRFLSSRRGNQILSEKSGWLPAIVGVDLPEAMLPFKPLLEGYPRGMNSRSGDYPDAASVFGNHLHELVSPTGSVDTFLSEVRAGYASNLLADVKSRQRILQRNIASRDSAIAGFEFLRLMEPGEPSASRKVSESLEGQNQNETLRALLNFAAKNYRGGSN